MLKLTKIYGWNLGSDYTQICYNNRVKITLNCLIRYIHGFHCESSLQYGDGKNSKTHQNLWLKY